MFHLLASCAYRLCSLRQPYMSSFRVPSLFTVALFTVRLDSRMPHLLSRWIGQEEVVTEEEVVVEMQHERARKSCVFEGPSRTVGGGDQALLSSSLHRKSCVPALEISWHSCKLR